MDETLLGYRRAQDEIEAVLAKIGADQWDSQSACSDWTVRDVAGHVIWGQRRMRTWATGEEFTDRTGAPGSTHPGVLTGADPLQTWREARAACDAALTDSALARTAEIPGLGDIPVAGLVTLLLVDSTTHSWDMAHPLDMDIQLPPDLIARGFEWARPNIRRVPGFFGPEVTAPTDTDDQTRLMAFLGRAVS